METNISYNASSQTTAQVLPPSARLGSIVSLGIHRVGSGIISASWEKGENRSTLKHWRSMTVLSDKSPDDRRAPYLFGRTLSVGGVDYILGGVM